MSRKRKKNPKVCRYCGVPTPGQQGCCRSCRRKYELKEDSLRVVHFNRCFASHGNEPPCPPDLAEERIALYRGRAVLGLPLFT